MAKPQRVRIRNDITAEKLGITEDQLATAEAETKASLARTKNVSQGMLSADDIRATNQARGLPSDIGEAAALERERIAFEQRLLDATPGQQPGEIDAGKMTPLEPQGSTITQPPMSQVPLNSAQTSLQTSTTTEPSGVTISPGAPSQSQPDQLQQQFQKAAESDITSEYAFAFDPLSGFAEAAKRQYEKAPEGSFRKVFTKHMFEFAERSRIRVRALTRSMVGFKLFGVGPGERVGDLRQKLKDSKVVLTENEASMNDIIDAFKAGEITQDQALQGFLEYQDQILENEQAVIAVSNDPLAFKLGEMEDDLTNFRNFRQTRLPELQRQLSSGVRVR